jgi:heterodisulfide reductase subunit D
MAEINMEQLLNCALCPNMCRCDCPVLQALGHEKVAPAGKARFAAMHKQDHLELSEEITEAIASCLGCRGCTILCPFPELNLCDELLYARIEENSRQNTLPSWEPYLANLKKYSSPYGQKALSGNVGNRGAEILYFAGCTTLANRQQSIAAVEKLFKKAGIAYQFINEDCCGYPAETWGDPALALSLAAENRRKFIESGARILVTGCPECWMTFTGRYPDWDLELPLEIIDAPSFFLKLVNDGLLKPKKISRSKISYHDPCIWARTAQKIKEPRLILGAIPDLMIEEPLASKENTHCCGGGRMFQLSFPIAAEIIARNRLYEFPDQCAIVTSCPFCVEGLNQNRREIIDLAELLVEACCKE